MKKRKRPLWAWMVAFAMAVLLMTSSAIDVQAAESEVAEGEVIDGEMTAEEMLRSIFSLEYYAEHNPDVVAVYGYNYDALYQHYIGCGIHEGRDVSPIVNLRLYRDCNADLLATYGDDFMGVLLHFTESGISEVASGLRQPIGVRFDPVAYMEDHPEANLLASGDMLKAAELFIYEGMPEGEWIAPDVVEDVKETETVTTNSVKATISTFVATEQPSENSSYSDDSSSDDSSSDSSSSDEEVSRPAETEQPSIPPAPSCNHAAVICGEKCDVCGAVIGHDFGESGTEPYCRKCNANYVQVNGCNHPEWNGGACVYCHKVDMYYHLHDTYHVDEFCPDCGYQGTLLYNEDECPGHEYNDDGVCRKCHGKKAGEEVPPVESDDPEPEPKPEPGVGNDDDKAGTNTDDNGDDGNNDTNNTNDGADVKDDDPDVTDGYGAVDGSTE